MSLPPPTTPLYNHPLPKIENWLSQLGCHQDQANLHCWTVQRPNWSAELYLEMEELVVRYLKAGDGEYDIQRAFKYSLSRWDIEEAIFSGP